MRLLNTGSLLLEEFFDEETPKYAILSHRWTRSECSFQDWLHPEDLDINSAGYTKIVNFSSVAKSYGYTWVWIDTICIDKKSSAELSEAINSMHRWYEDAGLCYAYLADCKLPEARTGFKQQLRHSDWFTRGWTLQELLAPEEILFYDRDWTLVGSKAQLADIVSRISGIPGDVISGSRSYKTASVAMKMSWASRRRTTRREDMAYCLLGLFNVNMPLLYGEGHKAFMRLQLEIIKISDDESIFAWTSVHDWKPYSNRFKGMLALSPAMFGMSSNVVASSVLQGRAPYVMTNKGLQIRMPVEPDEPRQPETRLRDEDEVEVALNCSRQVALGSPLLTVKLRMVEGRWFRVDCHELGEVSLYRSRVQDAEFRYVVQPGL